MTGTYDAHADVYHLAVLADRWQEIGESRGLIPEMFHRYRWKGRILRAMVESKLQPSYGQKPVLNDALDLFFKAVSVRDQAKPGTSLKWLPLHPAGSMLHSALTNQRERWGAVDSQRYDSFRQLTHVYYKGRRGPSGQQANNALLDLFHPKTPDGLPLYNLLRHLFSAGISKHEERFLAHIKYSGSANQENHFWYFGLTKAVYALQVQGYTSEAVHLREIITQNFPDLDRHTDKDLQQYASGKLWTWTGPTVRQEDETGEAEEVRVPFPAFT
ncbi:hypothetical protein LTS10_007328 [Elasticomyces elasticus]|nr:hypothetical protein LTS10_007328 [Elasticomyces elasticus]